MELFLCLIFLFGIADNLFPGDSAVHPTVEKQDDGNDQCAAQAQSEKFPGGGVVRHREYQGRHIQKHQKDYTGHGHDLPGGNFGFIICAIGFIALGRLPICVFHENLFSVNGLCYASHHTIFSTV